VSTGIYDVRMYWHEGLEATLTVRATSPAHARKRAREFALSRTTAAPARVSVKKVRVL
jgi:hypothetical protein